MAKNMKMYLVAAVAVLAVLTLFGTSSEAQVMKFEHFSINVPKGWQVNEDKANSTVAFVAPDNSAVLTIAIIKNEGMSIEEYAKGTMKEMKGRDLQKMDDGYMFRFTSGNGVNSIGILTGDGDLVMFMAVIGEHNDIDGMVNSMKQN